MQIEPLGELGGGLILIEKAHRSNFSLEQDRSHTPMIEDGDAGTDHTRQWNPLSTDPAAGRFSSYAAFNGKAVRRPLAPDAPIDAELIDAHHQLRQRILDQSYPCTGAISAFSQHCYRFGLYPELACDSAVRAVCHDLYCFCHEFTPIDDNLITFVAMFRGPAIQSERHFEDLLWNQLQAMHTLDSGFFTWDKSVESDPASDHFSYSIGGRAMFVIGMHPKASRLARAFPYPTLVFNLHEQFEGLRARGKLEAMKQTIQAREMALQSSTNPMLADFGENSEARQYSGRAVSENWVCPFHVRKKGTQEGTMITAQVTRIPPQSGRSFRIKRGQTLRVIDPLGEQVSDLFAFDEHDLDCRLSSGRSLDYASRIYLTTNDILYANNSKPMFTIVDDTVGLHDFLLTPCSQEMFEILYKHKGPHPSCLENLFLCLSEYGVSEADISTTFNIFMNAYIDAQRKLTVGAPLSKAGDHIDLRAEMDMLCGLTACSAEGSNNGRFKPIDFMILG